MKISIDDLPAGRDFFHNQIVNAFFMKAPNYVYILPFLRIPIYVRTVDIGYTKQ